MVVPGAGQPVRAGTGPLPTEERRSGPDQLAGRPITAVSRPGRGRGHGRVRRLQDRRDRSTTRGHHRDGPLYAEVRIMPMLGGLGLVTAVALPVRSA